MKIELSHDILAKNIYDKVSAEDKMVSKMQTSVQNRYVRYQESKILIDRNTLNYLTPYLKRLTLTKEEKKFIQKSKRRAFIKSAALYGGIAATLIFLVFYGAQATKTYYNLSSTMQLQFVFHHKLDSLQEKRQKSEITAKKVLANNELNINTLENLDEKVVQQMILQYEDQGKKQEITRQQRDLARSATISDLANEALDQDDLTYAFQLAVKAYELNPDNEQAIELLEELCNPEESIEEMSKEAVQELIKKTRKKYHTGSLSKKAMKAIFKEDNSVVKGRSEGVKNLVKKTRVTEVQKQIELPALLKEIEQHKVITEPLIDIIQTFPNGKKTPIKKPQQQKPQQENPKQENPKPRQENPKNPIPSSVPEVATAPPSPKTDCAESKSSMDQWIPLKKGERYTVFCKFSAEGKLLFMFKNNTGLPILPSFSKIKFYNDRGDSKSVTLADAPSPKGKKVYVARLSSKDIALLKNQRVVRISFQKLGGGSIAIQQTVASQKPGPSINNSFGLKLKESAQQQLYTLSQCLL